MTNSQYTMEMLQTWRIGRLGCSYMNSFIILKNDLEQYKQQDQTADWKLIDKFTKQVSQLELLTQALRAKSYQERKNLLTIIRYSNNIKRDQNEKQFFLNNDMLNYYISTVMNNNTKDLN